MAEADDKQIVFTGFDPVQGRKTELAKVAIDADFASWELSPDGGRVALGLFDYKAGDIQIVPLAGGATQKLSTMPWTELATLAFARNRRSAHGPNRQIQTIAKAQVGYLFARPFARRPLSGVWSRLLQCQRVDDRIISTEIAGTEQRSHVPTNI